MSFNKRIFLVSILIAFSLFVSAKRNRKLQMKKSRGYLTKTVEKGNVSVLGKKRSLQENQCPRGRQYYNGNCIKLYSESCKKVTDPTLCGKFKNCQWKSNSCKQKYPVKISSVCLHRMETKDKLKRHWKCDPGSPAKYGSGYDPTCEKFKNRVCTQCKPYYMLLGNKCKDISALSEECSKDGNGLMTNGGCDEVWEIPGCLVYQNPWSCALCESGKAVFNSEECKEIEASSIVKDCANYYEDEEEKPKCYSCKDGKVPISSGSKCGSVSTTIDHCVVYNDVSGSTCSKCEGGFLLNGEGNECYSEE